MVILQELDGPAISLVDRVGYVYTVPRKINKENLVNGEVLALNVWIVYCSSINTWVKLITKIKKITLSADISDIY
jgi:hypothetical protein